MSLRQDLVDANRILCNEGVLDAFGHVSARLEQHPERFVLAGNIAPALVTEDDLIEFDLDGTPVVETARRLYVERYLHAEIYRARPDVNAIVHSHSAACLPFAVSRKAVLRPVCHMGGFLGTGAPVFEIRETGGRATDLLIRSNKLGAALARTLGSHAVVLMRGHGLTAVASSLPLAVYRAVYTELNARVQQQAEQLGDVTYLAAEEAEATARANEGQVDRPWQLWKAKARASGL